MQSFAFFSLDFTYTSLPPKANTSLTPLSTLSLSQFLCLYFFSSLTEVRSLHNKWQLRIIACCCHRNQKADLCTTLFSLSLSVSCSAWKWQSNLNSMPPTLLPSFLLSFITLFQLLFPASVILLFSLLTPSFPTFFLSLAHRLSPSLLSVLPQPSCCFSSKLNLRSLSCRVLHMQKAGSHWVYACVCVLFAAVISEEWGWVEI